MKRTQSALKIGDEITRIFKASMQPHKTPPARLCPVFGKAGQLLVAGDDKALETAPGEAELEQVQRGKKRVDMRLLRRIQKDGEKARAS